MVTKKQEVISTRVILKWHVYEEIKQNSVERYCHNCGKKVLFKDCLIRRENANGKNIYRFAIYKCEKGHTWNKTLKIFKSYKNMKENVFVEKETEENDKCYLSESFMLSTYKELGVKEIEIILEKVEGKWRLDKLLSSRIEGLSRSKIQKLIEEQKILIDGRVVKPNQLVRENESITIKVNSTYEEK
jgi:hypothetical protein